MFRVALVKVAGEESVDSVIGEFNVFFNLPDLALLKLPIGLSVYNVF
jgi:hypothetical protein